MQFLHYSTLLGLAVSLLLLPRVSLRSTHGYCCLSPLALLSGLADDLDLIFAGAFGFEHGLVSLFKQFGSGCSIDGKTG